MMAAVRFPGGVTEVPAEVHFKMYWAKPLYVDCRGQLCVEKGLA